MAIKVVSEDPEPRRVTCAKCRYVLEYEPEDVLTEVFLNRDRVDYALVVVCPRAGCGCRNPVGE